MFNLSMLTSYLQQHWVNVRLKYDKLILVENCSK